MCDCVMMIERIVCVEGTKVAPFVFFLFLEKSEFEWVHEGK